MQRQFRGLFGKLVLTALCVWLALSYVHAKPELGYNQSGVASVYDSTLYQQVSDTYRADGDSTKSKLLASILAFPVPFGMLGLHRIYLGAKPIIPVLYIVTFGGIVGILPFIDMMVLILSKDTKPFVDNSNIFFWYKGKK